MPNLGGFLVICTKTICEGIFINKILVFASSFPWLWLMNKKRALYILYKLKFKYLWLLFFNP